MRPALLLEPARARGARRELAALVMVLSGRQVPLDRRPLPEDDPSAADPASSVPKT